MEELFLAQVRKPLQVDMALRNKGIRGYTNRQLKNYLAQLRKKHMGPATGTTLDLKEWCEANETCPEDENEPYVHAYEVCHEQQSFRICITTKKLLKTVAASKVLQIDATYKVNWQGYPAIVAGVADANKSFFPCMVSVLASETSADYAFVLKALRDGASLVSGSDYAPDVVVGDMARAITGAITEVFPAAVRRVCWFHVKKAVEEKARKEPAEARDMFLADLADLQLSLDEDMFWHSANLMLDKWSAKCPESAAFLEYFKTSILGENYAFYEGAHRGSPSTNNGLEAVNGVIKRLFTFRERLPLSQWMRQMIEIARNWSADLGDRRKVCSSPEPTLAELTAAHQWISSKKHLVEYGQRVFIPAGDATALGEGVVGAYTASILELRSDDFDSMVMMRRSVYHVDVGDKDTMQSLRCSCRVHLKRNLCKHVYGLGSFWGLVEMPEAAKAVPIGQKRKRGRPCQAKRALQRQ